MKIRINPGSAEFRALLKRGGYTSAPHEYYDKLLMRADAGIKKNEHIILAAIIRQTYGWNTTRAQIATSIFEKLTGLHPRRIREALRSLENKRILIQHRPHSRELRRAKEWGINPKANEWLLSSMPEDENSQRTKTAYSEGTKRVAPEGTNRRTNRDKAKDKIIDSGTAHKNQGFRQKLLNDIVSYPGLTPSGVAR